jgi:hypothetical protein
MCSSGGLLAGAFDVERRRTDIKTNGVSGVAQSGVTQSFSAFWKYSAAFIVL